MDWGRIVVQGIVFGTPTVILAFLLLGWLTKEKPQLEWECRPQPGYCDIDTDWRPPVKK